ncbi:PDR/VanB family oxidoreductase [Sphingomonas naphthae]|uniref:PDR/VanB family oxidoreductase n=1 Tax=Sphingomonas naphthae TaxID=1813468 RepID=A0ABY7TJF6_9SPHN|nr:PDR/VanB family oxidoreductase [Sphingomonas naphthae]WCT73086.1 PDR/VanB family oxidoreductase [Sphingomonas naphthae]
MATPIAARLYAIRWLTDTIRLFEVGPADGAESLPPANPGAHVDVHLPGGLVRQYSLLPATRRDRYAFAVKHETAGRGGSRFLHEQAQVGMPIAIGRPRDLFPLHEDAPRTVLIAGGIGITPVLSMLERLRALGRPVELHYWCREARAAPFADILGAGGDCHIHGSDDPSRRSLEAVIADVPADAYLYCCGPQRMAAMFEALCADRPADQVRLERFAADAPPLSEDDGAFEVSLARSGTIVRVEPGETMLEALIGAGVDILYSCEQGICGACETRVLAGEPDHRDSIRTAAAHDQLGTIMPCCSRAKSSTLVLDL